MTEQLHALYCYYDDNRASHTQEFEEMDKTINSKLDALGVAEMDGFRDEIASLYCLGDREGFEAGFKAAVSLLVTGDDRLAEAGL